VLGGLHWVLPKSLGPARADISLEGDISRLGVSLLAWSAKAIAKKPPRTQDRSLCSGRIATCQLRSSACSRGVAKGATEEFGEPVLRALFHVSRLVDSQYRSPAARSQSSTSCPSDQGRQAQEGQQHKRSRILEQVACECALPSCPAACSSWSRGAAIGHTWASPLHQGASTQCLSTRPHW